MGKDSEYNKQKDLNYRYKLKGLKQELPSYTYEFLDEKAQRNPNTAVSYAYDLRTFLIYLQEFCPAAKDYDTKDIPLEILNNLSRYAPRLPINTNWYPSIDAIALHRTSRFRSSEIIP